MSHPLVRITDRSENVTELRYADEEARNRRVLPAQLDVVGEARDPDEVEFSFADHLVCDVDFAAPRILRFRLHWHSLARDLVCVEIRLPSPSRNPASMSSEG